MGSRRSTRRALGAAVIIFSAVLGSITTTVRADGVSDQKQRVQQIADQLDSIADQVGQLDEDYGAALDRKDQLDIEIADSQARIDAQEAELGQLQARLSEIAVQRFTSGGGVELSPLFSDATTYLEAQQRSQFAHVAIEGGVGDADAMQALAADLADEHAALDRKEREAAALIKVLDEKKAKAAALEAEYEQKYTDAKAELGDLIQQEQERRAQQAIADAEAEAAAREAAAKAADDAAKAAEQPGRGGGTGTGTGSGSGSGSGSGTGTGSGSGTGSGTGSDTGSGTSGSSIPPPSSKAGIAVAAAYSQLGVPYRFAAESPGVAFDCSGLTKYAWGKAGVSLPHQSAAQYASTVHVPKSEVQPGDLVFYKSPIGHVGIYVGSGQMIHAPRTGDVVKVSVVNWSKVVGVSRPG